MLEFRLFLLRSGKARTPVNKTPGPLFPPRGLTRLFLIRTAIDSVIEMLLETAVLVAVVFAKGSLGRDEAAVIQIHPNGPSGSVHCMHALRACIDRLQHPRSRRFKPLVLPQKLEAIAHRCRRSGSSAPRTTARAG